MPLKRHDSPVQQVATDVHGFAAGVHVVTAHVPALQYPRPAGAPAHAFEHAPQCRASVSMLISQPFATVVSQSANPALHMPTAHTPAVHAGAALGAVQAIPQTPQFDGSLAVSTSQPFTGLASQLVKPALQDTTLHTPAVQVETLWAVAQVVPHTPQWVRLV